MRETQPKEARGDVRIVSLLPSATELIAHVLLERQTTTAKLVGVSHECDYPPAVVNDLPQLTSSTIRFTSSADVDKQVREHLNTGAGLYAVDKDKLNELMPDVIVTQSLCKVCSVDFCVVEQLALAMENSPTLVDTNPQTLGEVLEDLVRVGAAVGLERDAITARKKLEARIDAVRSLVESQHRERKRVCVLEWTDPLFIGGHWTPQLVSIAGGQHPLNPATESTGAGKSTTVTSEELLASNPDVIVIAPCGLDLQKATEESKALMESAWWQELTAVQNNDVFLVDGNQMFNRPGPRLVDALEWLCTILHDGANFPGVSMFPAVRLDQVI
jgi:iron complex transport system substrate-binding protein